MGTVHDLFESNFAKEGCPCAWCHAPEKAMVQRTCRLKDYKWRLASEMVADDEKSGGAGWRDALGRPTSSPFMAEKKTGLKTMTVSLIHQQMEEGVDESALWLCQACYRMWIAHVSPKNKRALSAKAIAKDAAAPTKQVGLFDDITGGGKR